jgi:uncharacterized protein YidB (DUF937 family)
VPALQFIRHVDIKGAFFPLEFSSDCLTEARMGLLDGILGGIVGAEATHLISGVIEQHGGLSGLAAQFQKQGLGGVMQSWISTGANSPISAEQIQQVLGSNTVTQLAAKLGLNPQDVAQKLAQMLPQAVDKMTPGGVLPTR